MKSLHALHVATLVASLAGASGPGAEPDFGAFGPPQAPPAFGAFADPAFDAFGEVEPAAEAEEPQAPPKEPAKPTYAELRARAIAENKPLVCWVGEGDIVCPACVRKLGDEVVHYTAKTFPETPLGEQGGALVVGVPDGAGGMDRAATITRWITGDDTWGHVASVRRAVKRWKTTRTGVASGWSLDHPTLFSLTLPLALGTVDTGPGALLPPPTRVAQFEPSTGFARQGETLPAPAAPPAFAPRLPVMGALPPVFGACAPPVLTLPPILALPPLAYATTVTTTMSSMSSYGAKSGYGTKSGGHSHAGSGRRGLFRAGGVFPLFGRRAASRGVAAEPFGWPASRGYGGGYGLGFAKARSSGCSS